MKARLFLSFLVSLLIPMLVFSQSHKKELKKYQKQQNKAFKNPDISPLPKNKIKDFKKHDFFTIDEKYRIEAEFKRTLNTLPFKMKTTTDRLPTYQKFGEAHFELDGKACVLTIYKNLDLMGKPEYENYLFLPFTDETNGRDTYGGGRYLNLETPDGETIVIDFNKAYNPYCAYDTRYSCPIPPKENNLSVAIKAGVKNYAK